MKRVNKKKIIFGLLTIISILACSCGTNPPDNKIHTVDDLNNKIIGVQLGTTGDLFASDIEGATLERYNKGADAVMSLKLGKVDCVIIDEQPAKEFVKINSDLKILEEEFVSEDYAICIKKGNTELVDKINGAIKELREDGTLERIINNYVGENAGDNPYKSPKDTDRSNGVLKMATNAEFAPYEFIEKGKITGIDVDLAKAIADKLGMELEIDNIAFDSIITAVSAGKADMGIAGMTVTEERLKNIDFSDSYTTSKQVIIVRKK
ncbi:MAG: transporter substrate-binding domain-containing protein [Lachnospiraceae bacterium]|nr:transporter substrate-binding domain-containing protein [Lachnospiraceae bacterium]